MSALAQKHNAINLSQGFPDFKVNENLIKEVTKAMNSNFNQYAPMPGLPLLRDSIAKRVKTKYKVSLSADTHITVTPGASYGIYNALASFIMPGDEIIILEPAYDSYAPNIISLGGKIIRVALNGKNFAVDWERIADVITTKTNYC